MTSVLRRFLVVTLAASFAALSGPSARAATSDDLDAARQRLAAAKSAAGASAAELSDAENKLAGTENLIAELRATIDTQRARAASLQDIARERAVYAYTHVGQDLDVLTSGDDAVDTIRRQQLLDHANQRDNDAVRKLAAINADLREQELSLKRQEAQQRDAKAALDAKARDLNAKLADAQAAAGALQAKLDREIAAAEAARKAALEAERARLAAGRSGTATNGPAGQIIVNPGGGSFMCPVAGAVYSDDFGGARGHPGIDMFVPTGTPAVAVKAGSVFFMPNDGAGGNEAYVNADDGNTYFYAHFSGYAGGARAVAQGEVIGYTGMTGNASAPHLHFEIRIGGPNGGRINPYPTLKSAGC